MLPNSVCMTLHSVQNTWPPCIAACAAMPGRLPACLPRHFIHQAPCRGEQLHSTIQVQTLPAAKVSHVADMFIHPAVCASQSCLQVCRFTPDHPWTVTHPPRPTYHSSAQFRCKATHLHAQSCRPLSRAGARPGLKLQSSLQQRMHANAARQAA